jgi:5'-3' exonuclease
MGVPYFFKWLQDNNKNNLSLINSIIDANIHYLMIDANCLLHPCVANIVEKYKNKEINAKNRNEIEELIWNRIEEYINDLIQRTKPENIFIAVDGVAPMGKINQQRQRRYKNGKNVIVSDMYPTQTIELTPATKYMEKIHKKFINYCKILKINVIYSSYLEENEGEHKILQYIKNNIEEKKRIVIYGLDADLLFLALTDNMKHEIFIMRERQIFENKEIEDDIIKNLEYNYVRINELNNVIKEFDITANEFVVICYFIGNDFLPALLSIDIKHKGLVHIMNAYKTVKRETRKTLIENDKINFNVLLKVFEKIEWTEKNVFQFNTLFNNEEEYYKYYFNTDIIYEDDKKKMVEEYLKTIDWCYTYYTKECKSWSHCYKYMMPPLIKDIMKYYPNKIEVSDNYTKLRAIEQLILVIPPEMYKYVLSEEDNNIIKNSDDMLCLNYMFPKYFETDVNKEKIEWKQHILIPFIDYEYFIDKIRMVL